MNNAEIERIYTALAECIGRAGEAGTSRLLAVLALDLLSRQPNAEAALERILKAERLAKL